MILEKKLRDTAIRELRKRYAAVCCVLVLALAVVSFAVDGAACRCTDEDGVECELSTEAARCGVEPIVGKEDVKEYEAILKTLDIPQK